MEQSSEIFAKIIISLGIRFAVSSSSSNYVAITVLSTARLAQTMCDPVPQLRPSIGETHLKSEFCNVFST